MIKILQLYTYWQANWGAPDFVTFSILRIAAFTYIVLIFMNEINFWRIMHRCIIKDVLRSMHRSAKFQTPPNAVDLLWSCEGVFLLVVTWQYNPNLLDWNWPCTVINDHNWPLRNGSFKSLKAGLCLQGSKVSVFLDAKLMRENWYRLRFVNVSVQLLSLQT